MATAMLAAHESMQNSPTTVTSTGATRVSTTAWSETHVLISSRLLLGSPKHKDGGLDTRLRLLLLGKLLE